MGSRSGSPPPGSGGGGGPTTSSSSSSSKHHSHSHHHSHGHSHHHHKDGSSRKEKRGSGKEDQRLARRYFQIQDRCLTVLRLLFAAGIPLTIINISFAAAYAWIYANQVKGSERGMCVWGGG
jgi:hypothetical protein